MPDFGAMLLLMLSHCAVLFNICSVFVTTALARVLIMQLFICSFLHTYIKSSANQRAKQTKS